MAAEKPAYDKWLEAKKKVYRRQVHGGRLDKFAAAVRTNQVFQSICDAFLRHGNRQADDVDEVDEGRAEPHVVILSPELQSKVHFLLETARMGCCATLETEFIKSTVERSPNAGARALHIVVENGNVDDAKALVEFGAKVGRDEKGFTPLHVAAASTTPNPEIAKLLIEHMKSDKTINAIIPNTSNDESIRGNTALHFAADNEHMSPEFIRTLADIDPAIKNSKNETAFIVAANAENPAIIVSMLEVFKHVWQMKDIETDLEPTLLEICAKSGNAEAVALLIKYGVKISQQLLFQMIDESTKYPTKTDKLIGVHRTITENCVLWDWLAKSPDEREQRYPRLGTEPEKHRRKQRDIMFKQLTEPNETYERRNVIEHAIVKGNKAFLTEIVNTRNVFRIEDSGSDVVQFDVTDFIPSSSDCRTVSQVICSRSRRRQISVGPQQDPDSERRRDRSYFDAITQKKRSHLWENKNILQLEPFFTITQPICTFVQLIYFAMALIQLVHMIVFSVYYMPPYSSLSNRLNFKQSAQWNSSEIPACPFVVNVSRVYTVANSLWLLWPTAIFFGTVYICYGRHSGFRETVYEYITSRLIFPPIIWVWYFSTFVWQKFYLTLTSAVYLFGWLATLSFFIDTIENASIFSFLLKQIIVEDILSSFGIIFFFVLLSFSSAIHLLRLKALLGERCFFDTSYNLLASALTIGNFVDETLVESPIEKKHTHLMQTMFTVYLCCTTVILLNMLISMMNHHYEEARQKAKNVWMFRNVRTWIRLSPLFGFKLQRVLRTFRLYWKIATNKYLKSIVNTRYDEVSIDYGDRVILKVKYTAGHDSNFSV